jgi:hypothetical protein
LPACLVGRRPDTRLLECEDECELLALLERRGDLDVHSRSIAAGPG